MYALTKKERDSGKFQNRENGYKLLGIELDLGWTMLHSNTNLQALNPLSEAW